MANDLISPPELSERLGIPTATLAQWRYVGRKGPRWIKVGKHVRYRAADIDAWLDANTRGGVA